LHRRPSARTNVFKTFAGAPGGSASTDGRGNAARLNVPEAVAVDREGNVFVADTAMPSGPMIYSALPGTGKCSATVT
jgi:hypothetical protein